MSAFPTLANGPLNEDWDEGRAFDPTIRSRSEGGYTKTRPRTTRIPDFWKFSVYVTDAEKSALETFEKATVHVGADAFTWTHPGGSSKTVRLSEKMTYRPIASGLWKVRVCLEEV